MQALRGDMQHLKRELAGAKQAAAGAAAEVEELQQALAAATAAQQEGLAKQAELVLALEGAQAGAAELEARVSSLSTSLATREEEVGGFGSVLRSRCSSSRAVHCPPTACRGCC